MEMSVTEKAKNGINKSVEEVQGLAKRAEHGIDQATTRVGDGLTRSAERVRENAEVVAHRMEDAGSYLQRTSVRDIGGALGETVRRHPVAAVGVGAGIGFLLGSMLFRRRG